MSKRAEHFIIASSFAFILVSVTLISASIFRYHDSSEHSLFSVWGYAGMIAAIVAGLFSLQLFILRFQTARNSLRLRNQQLEALSLSNQQINQRLEVPAVMRALVEAALDLTGASDGAAGLFIDGQMVFTEYFKNGTWVPIDFTFPPGYGVPGWVIENKRPYLSNDTMADLQVIPEIRDQLGFYNLADTPILNAQGELLGCFEIHNTRDHRPFDEQDIVVLKGLSSSAAIAIENARIIADQKKSEARLSESERSFRSLFENSPVSLWEEDLSEVKQFLDDIRRQGVSDLNSFFKTNPEAAIRCSRMVRVIDVNRATVELFSARTKADLLSHLSLIFTDKSYEPFNQGLIVLAQGQTSYKATAINKTLAGEEIEINIHASIIPGHEETWEKVIVSMADVTHEREIDRLKNEFISTAAHELRTPLAVIMGYSDLLIEHLASTEFSLDQKKEFLLSINKKVVALERIVEDLLDVSKIESGRPLLLEKTPTKLAKLLKELIRNHQRETKRHRIVGDFDDLHPMLMLDASRITQVLDNLLNNAIKYSPDGGDITVNVRQVNELLEISVADHGLGMTADQAERVFDKFYRADTSNTARGGLGLGMSIAKNIVEAHGGRIWLESAPGKGTVVTFTLPLQTKFNDYFTQEIPGTSQLH